MFSHFHKRKNYNKSLSIFVIFAFFLNFSVIPVPGAYAQGASQALTLNLPAPGTLVPPSAPFVPAIIRGITIHPENPLEFDFIVDTGNSALTGDALNEEATRLIKYFLAALTVPEDDLWVNLSPYEENRIIPDNFGNTEMGRDLLSQDYILKQLVASMVYPEDQLGKEFWARVQKKARELYGTTEIPVNTFNKVWIIPDKAVVYQSGANAFVVNSHLKVMLEEDYLSVRENLQSSRFGTDRLEKSKTEEISGVSSEVIREILIPEIEKEVNYGKNFAATRQVYNAMILATWFKQNLKQSLLGQVYVDQNKIKGVDVEDRTVKEKIYDQYIAAFKKGVYNYVREDYDPVSQQIIPRKYYSGGYEWTSTAEVTEVLEGPIEALPPRDRAMLSEGFEPVGDLRSFNVTLLENAGSEDEDAIAVRPLSVVSNPADVDGSVGTMGDDLDNVAVSLTDEDLPVEALPDAAMLTEQTETIDRVPLVRTVYDKLIADVTSMAEELGRSVSDEPHQSIISHGVELLARLAIKLEKREIKNPGVAIRASLNDPEVEPVESRLRIGVFPIAGNPPHWAHLLLALEALVEKDLDKIIFVVAGEDPRKTNLVANDIRHPMNIKTLAIFQPFFEYSSIAIGTDLDGERNIFRILELNPKQQIDAFYLVGADHYKRRKIKPIKGLGAIPRMTDSEVSDVLFRSKIVSAAGGNRSVVNEVIRAVHLLKDKVTSFDSTIQGNLVREGISQAMVERFIQGRGDFVNALNQLTGEDTGLQQLWTLNRETISEALVKAGIFDSLAADNFATNLLEVINGIFQNSETFQAVLYTRGISLEVAQYIVNTTAKHEDMVVYAEEDDTIQKLEDNIRAKIYGFNSRVHKVMPLFLERKGEEVGDKRIPTTLNVEILPPVQFVASSTAIRNGDLSILPHAAYQHIKTHKLYGVEGKGDPAQLAEVLDEPAAAGIAPIAVQGEATPVGGIDFDSALLDLQVRRDQNGVPLPISQQPIPDMKINGFLPVIIKVTPVPSIPFILGMTGETGAPPEEDSVVGDLSALSVAGR